MSHAALSPDQLLHQLNWRYATKSFDSGQSIPPAVWNALEQSLLLAPSSFGLQPWKFFVVTNPEVRKKMQEAAWGQTQVVEASHLVVLARKLTVTAEDVDRHLQRMADVRSISTDSLQGFGDMVKGFLQSPPYPMEPAAWAARQVYVALGQLLTSAAMLGIDACPMEGFIPAKVDEILGLPDQDYGAIVLCALGYRSADDKYASMAKVRFPKDAVMEHI